MVSSLRRLYTKFRRDMTETILSHSSENNYRCLVSALAKIAKTEHQKMIATWVTNWVSFGNPGAVFLTRAFRQLHPNMRKKYLAKMITNPFPRDQEIYKRFREKCGFNPPSVMLVSPTMRYNYRCTGCYAGNYGRDNDLPPEIFDRVLTEEVEALYDRRGISFLGW